MSDKIYEVPAQWQTRAYADLAKYKQMYARSLKDPNGFWAEQAKRIDWIKPFTKVKNTSFDPHNVSIKWFEDGALNVAYNCVDRHLAKRGDQTAIIWEGDDPKDDRKITYKQLHAEVCRFANVAQGARRQKRRPRHHLHADDSGSGDLACSPARASARCIRWCSAASRRIRSPGASRTANPPSSSPPTKACAAAARCRSRPMPTPPPTRPAA